MADMKDVARLAGVSISTVSNVLNGSRYVTDATKERVLEAVDELNYEVDYIASSMKSNRTKMLGVVVPSISRIFFPEVISGMQDVADDRGYHLLVYSTRDDIHQEKTIIKALAAIKVDGIIVDSIAVVDQETDYFSLLGSLHAGKKPIPVTMLEFDVSHYGIDSVFVDNFTGAMLATQKLLDRGARKIAFIATAKHPGRINERIDGYKRALLANGIDVNPRLICVSGTTPLGGFKSVEALIRNRVKFDAVFGGNDQTAIGAMKALMSRGIAIPEDVLVTGFDNIFISSIITPSLTTINVPKYDMGRKVCEMLIERIELNGRDLPARAAEMPIHLIERGSTDLNKSTEWELENW